MEQNPQLFHRGPVCVRAKFCDRLILPQIVVVFKSPTTKIDFVDFLQIQAAF